MLVLCTDTLKGYGLNRIFEFAKEAGYDGIDLQMDFRNFDTLDKNYVKRLSESTGVPVKCVSADVNASSKEVLDAVDIAKLLDAKVVIVQSPKILNFKYATWLKTEVPKIREREKISIALENAPASTLLGFIPEHSMANITEMKKFKHACLDTSRVAEKHQDLIRTYGILRKYLVHIHISNVFKGKKYYRLEEGILPLESFLTKLKQDDYQGYISVKVSPKFIQAGEDDKMIKHLKDFKDFYTNYFDKVDVKKDSFREDKESDVSQAENEML